MPFQYLNDQLQDYLSHLETSNIIATDASLSDEKAGVGIFSPSLSWSFSIRLPDYTPIFIAELLAIVLALRKLPENQLSAVVVTDSRSVCASLSSTSNTTILNVFQNLVPTTLQKVTLLWVPGHCGLHLNEMADLLARTSLSGPLIPILPDTAYVTASRFRTFCLRNDLSKLPLIPSGDFEHLGFCWNNQWCPSRQLEVTYSRLRCRIPELNFYLHRAGLTMSPLCHICKEIETIDHYFLSCRRYSNQRKILLEAPLCKIGLGLSTPVLLSFGASTLGYCHRDVCCAVFDFLTETRRLPC